MRHYRFELSWGPVLASLPDAEELALRRMIDLYIEREGPLPRDRQVLQALIRLDWDCIAPVLEKFFDVDDRGYIQDDLEAELTRLRKRRDASRGNGARGGRPRRV